MSRTTHRSKELFDRTVTGLLDAVEKVLEGVGEDDRRKLLYENALSVYQIKATVPA